MVSKRFTWFLSIVVSAGIAVVAHAVPPGSADEIRERTNPVGQLCRAGSACGGQMSAATGSGSGSSVGMSGQQVYDQFCFACHATGVTDAPKFANADDWAPRVAKGMDAIMESTINGLNIMPPKGTCMACSDDELRTAVDYMIGE